MYISSDTIGKRLKYLRKKRGISQDELGQAIGLTQNNISKIENDDISLTIDNLLRLSDFFNVTTDYICKGENNNSILNILEKYAYIEYNSLNCGVEHFNFPFFKINRSYFEYLLRIAQANSYNLPNEIKEFWLSKEVDTFNQSHSSNNETEYTSIIPVPSNYFYRGKNNFKHSDLLREIDDFYHNPQNYNNHYFRKD